LTGHCGPGPAVASGGTIVHNAIMAAASNSNVFFTVKLLIEVGLAP